MALLKGFVIVIMVWFAVDMAVGKSKQQDPEEQALMELDYLVQWRDSVNTREVSLDVIEQIKGLKPINDSLDALFKLEISTSFYDLKNYDSARAYLLQALFVAQKDNYELLLIQIYDRLGVVISDYGDNNQAIEYYQKALKIAESRTDQGSQIWAAKINGNIGGIYYDFEDFAKALQYAEKANEIAIQNDQKGRYGVYQMQMGLSNLGLKNYRKAAKQLQNSVDFFEENFNPLFLQYGYINVSRVYIELNDLNRAEESLQKTIALTDSIDALAESATISELMAQVSYRKRNYREAREYANRAMAVSLRHKMKMKEMQAFDILFKIDSASGNYKDALTHKIRYNHLDDSIRSQQTVAKIAELETKYETEKKEQLIALANAEIAEKERFQLFLFVVIGLILLMAVGGYILIRSRFRLKQELLSQEVSNLRIQLNALIGYGTEGIELEISAVNQKLNSPLTEREFSVLELALSDKNNKQIADTVHLSVNTVKYHLRNIYEKLGVSNRKEALEFVIQPR